MKTRVDNNLKQYVDNYGTTLFIENETEEYEGEINYHLILESSERIDDSTITFYIPESRLLNIAKKVIMDANHESVTKKEILDDKLKLFGGDIQQALYAAMDEYATKVAQQVRDELDSKRDNCYDFKQIYITKFLK